MAIGGDEEHVDFIHALPDGEDGIVGLELLSAQLTVPAFTATDGSGDDCWAPVLTAFARISSVERPRTTLTDRTSRESPRPKPICSKSIRVYFASSFFRRPAPICVDILVHCWTAEFSTVIRCTPGAEERRAAVPMTVGCIPMQLQVTKGVRRMVLPSNHIPVNRLEPTAKRLRRVNRSNP